jgi:acetylornithine deacetylase/succinyl-diaminopimelate desuccinylase-like protein
MTDASLDRALARLEDHWDDYLGQLQELVRIAGVSADPPPNEALSRSASAVVRLMEQAGLENCEVIDFPDAHPYAYGEWLHAEGAPTLLLYGHHDVQPPGRPDRWKSPPFEPTFGEDGRLYGRGAVDDKAGVMMHIAACGAWLQGAGTLPVNVKFIVEGEEEIGSSHLEGFLEQYKDRLDADAIVLTDTANLDAGIPSLTVSLRGLAGVRVDVQALEQPVHSGMWGGPVPDPVIALSRALSELTDADGTPANFLRQGVRALGDADRAAIERLPFDEARFKQQVGLVDGAQLVGNTGVPVWARIWREPAVSVIALEASPLEGSSNQILDGARARVSVRTVPDQDPRQVQDALVEHFETRVPWGVKTTVTREAVANWWVTDPKGPAFDAAMRAMEAGYGRQAEFIGCGGTIPFVEPFARVLGGIPALLTGVEDPPCAAHSENESLHVQDWQRGTRAAVHLYRELAGALGR